MPAHAQVIFQAHQPCIADVDTVQEGEHEEESEDGDDVEVTLAEKSFLGIAIGDVWCFRGGFDVFYCAIVYFFGAFRHGLWV